jgi:transposase-like protein
MELTKPHHCPACGSIRVRPTGVADDHGADYQCLRCGYLWHRRQGPRRDVDDRDPDMS